MEFGELLAEIVFKVDRVDARLRKIAWKKNLARMFDDLNRMIPQRDRLGGQVFEAFNAETGFGQLVDDLVQILPPPVEPNGRILTLIKSGKFVSHGLSSVQRKS